MLETFFNVISVWVIEIKYGSAVGGGKTEVDYRGEKQGNRATEESKLLNLQFLRFNLPGFSYRPT